MQKLAKRIANLSSKLSSDLKTLKTKVLSTEDSIKHILQQVNEIKNQVCKSEQSLVSQLQETSHQDSSPQHSTVIADSNEYTYTVATSNRFETLVEENHSIVETPNTQPNPASTTTSSSTAARTQPPISQPNDQLAFTSFSNQNHTHNPNERSSKGPVLLLGNSMIRGIQLCKFAPNRYVNKQIIAGRTRETRQYINHMQERNDYDYIVIHSGTNDVGNLGPVVQKPINANPRLKINRGVYFSSPKCCSTLIFGKSLHEKKSILKNRSKRKKLRPKS